MKFLPFYREVLGCTSEGEVFDYLVSNLKPSDFGLNQFVDWKKVIAKTKKIEPALKLLNQLIGSKNFDDKFRKILSENPGIVSVIPELVVRTKNNSKFFKILVGYENKKLKYKDFDFAKKSVSTEDIENCLTFVKKTGFKNFIVSEKVGNLINYMIGVEAALDSKVRKNRGKIAMENMVDEFVDDTCSRLKVKYINQASAKTIKQKFGYVVSNIKPRHQFDFAIDNGKELFLVETNFNDLTGSKLKATAGEYQNFCNELGERHNFIWITDGFGWAKSPTDLRNSFAEIDYVFNLAMLEKGILDVVLKP